MNRKVFNRLKLSIFPLLLYYCFYISSYNFNLAFLVRTLSIFTLFGAICFITSDFVQFFLQKHLLYSSIITLVAVLIGYKIDEKYHVFVYINQILIVFTIIIALIKRKKLLNYLFCKLAIIALSHPIVSLWWTISFNFSPRNGIIFDGVHILIFTSLYLIFTFILDLIPTNKKLKQEIKNE